MGRPAPQMRSLATDTTRRGGLSPLVDLPRIRSCSNCQIIPSATVMHGDCDVISSAGSAIDVIIIVLSVGPGNSDRGFGASTSFYSILSVTAE